MLMGPDGLPAPVRESWMVAMQAGLADPVLRPRIKEAGFLPGGGTSADAAALLARDAERYGALIRQAGIRIE